MVEESNNVDFTRLKLQVEAVLFSLGDWISVRELMKTLVLDSELLLNNALKELEEKYSGEFSFKVENEGENWRMTLKESYVPLVDDVILATEMPQNVLKVLGVIAYEQPISKTRLAEIMGKSVKNEVDYLFRMKFLSAKKKGIGKYYKVTKKFYDYFKVDEDEFKKTADKSMQTFLQEPEEIISGIEQENVESKNEVELDETSNSSESLDNSSEKVEK